MLPSYFFGFTFGLGGLAKILFVLSLLTVDASNLLLLKLLALWGLFPLSPFPFNCFFYFSKDSLIALNPDKLLLAGLSRWLSKKLLKALSLISILFSFPLFLYLLWSSYSYSLVLLFILEDFSVYRLS